VILTRGASLQDGMIEAVRRFAESRHATSFEALAELVTPTPRQRRHVQDRVGRGVSFAEAWAAVFVGDKFGQATTHWRKLEDRVHRGVGNPCPLLLIGIPDRVIQFEDGLPLTRRPLPLFSEGQG